MYQFTDELRNHYESLTTPLAFYQPENGRLIPLLMSEGLCELMGDEREKLVELFARDRLRALHPDDAPRVRTDMQAFLRKEGSYDRIYHTRFAHGQLHGQAV